MLGNDKKTDYDKSQTSYAVTRSRNVIGRSSSLGLGNQEDENINCLSGYWPV